MERYEIGEVVEWQVGNIISQGIVYNDDGGEVVEIQLVTVNGTMAYHHLSVKRNVLKRI